MVRLFEKRENRMMESMKKGFYNLSFITVVIQTSVKSVLLHRKVFDI